ncbi:MAG: LiaF domain-containing protein [Bacteroidota bacterium]
MNTQGRNIVGYLLFTVVAVATTGPVVYCGEKPGYKEIGRTTEREINVVLSSGWGKVVIKRGESAKIVSVDASPQNSAESHLDLSYAVRNRVGYLDVTLGEEKQEDREKGVFVVNNFESSDWFLNFSNALPISFDIELGVGKGDFDLTGLQIKDFNLTTGASDVFLRFDRPNTTSIDNINIESGLSKFYGQNLGNANFKRFRFQGGVGTTTLDFSGALNNEVDVDVEVGLGSVKVIVPQNIGARIVYEESWVSRLYHDKDFKKSDENMYITDNYSTSEGKMNIRIESGLGSVTIERR